MVIFFLMKTGSSFLMKTGAVIKSKLQKYNSKPHRHFCLKTLPAIEYICGNNIFVVDIQ